MPLSRKILPHGKNKVLGNNYYVTNATLDGDTLQLTRTSPLSTLTVDLSSIGGGGISFNGSTANGLVTYGNASTADVEANLTYDGTNLTLASAASNTERGISIRDNEGTETVRLSASSTDEGLLYLRGPTGGNAIYLDGNSDSYINNGANLGIGTTSPDSKLEVASTSEPSFRLSHTAGSIFTDFYTNSAGRAILKPTSGSNTSNGLAIGPITPAATLHVYDDNKSTFGKPRVLIQGGSNNTGDPMLSFKQDSGSNEWSMGLDNDDSDKFKLSRSSVLHSNTALTIDGSNNVGIGTASPNKLLSVSGQAIIQDLRINANDGDRMRLYRRADNEMVVAAESASLYLNSAYNGIYFEGDSSAVKMRMTGDGKFGIGTDGPDYPLHVLQGTNTYGMYMSNAATPTTRGIRFGDTNNNGTGYGRIEGIGGSLFLGSTQVYTSLIGTGDANTTLGSSNRRWSYFFGRYGQFGYGSGISENVGAGGYVLGVSGNADRHPFMVKAYGNNATPTLIVSSGSKVGIGLDTPTSKLHIKGELDIQSGNQTILMGGANSSTARNDNTLKLARVGLAHYDNNEKPVGMMYAYSNGTDNGLIIGAGTSNMNSPTKIQFTTADNDTTTAGTTRMTITSGGFVGIGTDGPNSKMTVQGDLDIPVNSRFRAGSGDNNHTGVDIYHNGSNNYTLIENRPSGGDLIFRQMHNGKDYIFKADNDSGTEQEVMRIDGSNASVGIGTEEPTSKLTISGGANDKLFNVVSGASSVLSVSGSNVGIGTDDPDKKLVIRTGGSRDFKFYDYDMTYESSLGIRAKNNGYLALVTEGNNDVFLSTNGFSNKRLVVKPDGDVGIGTTGPDARLEVRTTNNPQIRTSYNDSHYLDIYASNGTGYIKSDGRFRVSSSTGRYFFHGNGNSTGRAEMFISAGGDISNKRMSSFLYLLRGYQGADGAGIFFGKTVSGSNNEGSNSPSGREGTQWYAGLNYAGGGATDEWILGTNYLTTSGSGADGYTPVISAQKSDTYGPQGKVGINILNPQQPLHVLTSANDQGILIDVGDDTHEGRLLFGDTSSNAIGYVGYNHSLDAMRFFTNGSESLRLQSDQDAKFYGKLGVGGTVPGETLHVQGTSRVTGKAAFGSSTLPTNNGISVVDTIQIQEKSVFPASTSGWGTVWVSGSVPNKLYFTDDAGGHHDLTAGGGGTIGGSITDNQIAVGASTANSIEGSSNLTYDGSNVNVGTKVELQGAGTSTFSAANTVFGASDLSQNTYLKVLGSGAGYTSAGIKLLTYNGGDRPGGVYSYANAGTQAWYSGPIYGASFKWGINYSGSLANTGSALEKVADDANNLFIIDKTGKVGIGTTGPSDKLDVQDGYIRVGYTGGGQFKFVPHSTANEFGIYDANNTAYRFYIDNAGDVGIGTQSPSEKLTVNGNLFLSGSQSHYAVIGQYLRLQKDTSGVSNGLKVTDTGGNAVQTWTRGLFAGNSYSATPNIGEVILYCNDNAKGNAAGTLSFSGRDSGGTYTQYGLISGSIVDPANTSEDGKITVSTLVGGTRTDTLTVVSGNVGINLAAPGSRLHVSGGTSYNNTEGIRLGNTSTYASIYTHNSNAGLEIDSPHTLILDCGRHMEFHAGGTTREHRYMYATTQYGFMTTTAANSYWTIGNKSAASAGLLLSGASGGITLKPSDGNINLQGSAGVDNELIVTGSTLAVQKTMKNDIAGTHTISDSYSHYMATADNQGAATCTITCPASPSIGDEYFIVAQCIYASALPSNALVQITPNTGQTINQSVNAGSNIALHQVSSGTGAGGQPLVSYKTAHLICVDSGQWVLTVSDVGPTS